jgi:hypothetical protein
MARALTLASLPAAWIVPGELPCLMCWLAAEAAPMGVPPQSPPSGPLPLRALVARFSPRASACATALRGLAGTPDRFPKRTIHYETLYVVALLDDSC